MFNWKSYIVLIYDLLTIPVAWLGAYWIRENLSDIPHHLFYHAVLILPVIILVQAIVFWWSGLYRGVWRFASLHDLRRICQSAVIGAILNLFVIYFVVPYLYTQISMPPRSITLLYIMLLVFLLGGARLIYRAFREWRWSKGTREKVLVVGAGLAGEALVRELRRDHKRIYNPVVFVDDKPSKQGMEIFGIRVRGCINDIPELVKSYGIKQIFIAIPSAPGKMMRHIVDICGQTAVPYRTLPGLSALAKGEVTIQDLRDVSLDDLLGREAIDFDNVELQHGFTGKRVLVTGGGGSIGSELCRQLSHFAPASLMVVEHSEYNLYAIEMELRQKFPKIKFLPCLQSITNAAAIDRLFTFYQPQVVFHAAAYKHVPLLEHQALVAVNNNIMGTKTMAEAAAKHNVEKFVLVSTDKAVNPTNIMGTSKRIAEIFCQNLNEHSSTEFITVRFGNVLGSAGSVVPLFQKQLAAGGPLTVTHPDITRFFMTIPEACQLILQASQLGQGGEVFVLDMGEPIKITYLAEQVIKLSGKKLGEDIEIEFTGLRPGEKLYEELFHESETLQKTNNQKIFQAEARQVDWDCLQTTLKELGQHYQAGDVHQAIVLIKKLVPESHLQLGEL